MYKNIENSSEKTTEEFAAGAEVAVTPGHELTSSQVNINLIIQANITEYNQPDNVSLIKHAIIVCR